ncbi:MAG: class II D-tagatose-bisphosphate aldolase, non-catalytic subunit [Acidobacteria bacterium]|nr:class II D-tagatose-bisphosphate aldolase, non-catalytic subunit [Acidobacteriota bacterium]
MGVYAVCSAHPQVIAAAAHAAKENESVLHVESTSNQVNQFGGYTGQNSEQFANFVRTVGREIGLDHGRVLLGADHLGPFPWRHESASVAMDKARSLVRACVLTGYQKIHLDASMVCADDPTGGLDELTVAERAAALCEAAENASGESPPNTPALLYVVGTEVPAPGGESTEQNAISVTAAEHVESTLRTLKQAFAKRKLERAWDRIIGLVVEPGVEFGDRKIFDYDPLKARPLSAALPATPELVYEAHSTDYQLASSLKQMVEDHFAILKVGPELTFAFREAVFALSAIEHETLRGKHARLSNVRGALEAVMLRDPSYWRDYYHGDENRIRISQFYSYSDRCRYYWHEAEVKAELELLIENLTTHHPPLMLVSQYLPFEYEAVRAGRLGNFPSEIIRHHIRTVLLRYAAACGRET